MLEPTCEISG